ncbi:UDP-N-acetylmuramyl pentapeptide synthase [Clostridiales Family XIII bacterium PM5-7]
MNQNFIKVYRKLKFIKPAIDYYIHRVVSGITPRQSNDCQILHVDRKSKGDVQVAFLGEMNHDHTVEQTEQAVSQLNVALHEPDVIFCLDSHDGQQGNLFSVAQIDQSVVDLGEVKIGCAFFEEGQNIKCKHIMERLKVLKGNGANFTIAYVNDCRGLDRIGKWGFDFVVGLGQEKNTIKSIRRQDGASTRIFTSIGQEVSLRISIGKEPSKADAVVIQEGYLPLIIDEQGIAELKKPADMETDQWSQEYVRIDRQMRGMRNWNELILLRDIMDVIGESLSEKFKHLEKHSVGQICARTYELNPGNVLFFMPQLVDNNDGKVESELYRNRLLIRAITRNTLFTFSYKNLTSRLDSMTITDPREAHVKTMAWYKKNYVPAKFIGVTGSVGKTSTKDMLHAVLNERFVAEKNLRNTNVQVKIGINMQQISANCQYYVQEIGGGRPGGASRHSRMILPDAAIITNIGTAHIGNYQSQEHLMEHKLGIIDGMSKDGVLFLNGDDELLTTAKPPCKTVFFALHNREADYYADRIEERDGAVYFDVVHQGEAVPVKLNVLGEHNMLNAVCSFAVAKHFGMENEDIRVGLLNFKTEGIRQNIVTAGGYKFYVDCYNASMDSINSSLSTLTKLIPKENGKRIAIIGDVTGMGQLQQKVNDGIIEIIGRYQVDKLMCYGDHGKYICEGVRALGKEAEWLNEPNALEQWMLETIQRGDVVLLKGSSKVKFAERLDSAFGFDLADLGYIDGAKSSTIVKQKIKYRVFPEYASARKYLGQEEKVAMAGEVLSRPIKKILSNAFKGQETLREIQIGANVAHIGEHAFADCSRLERVSFPDSLRYIGDNGFALCTSLTEVELNPTIKHISPSAFAGCSNLEKIILPKDMDYLPEQYFIDCQAEIVFV